MPELTLKKFVPRNQTYEHVQTVEVTPTEATAILLYFREKTAIKEFYQLVINTEPQQVYYTIHNDIIGYLNAINKNKLNERL